MEGRFRIPGRENIPVLDGVRGIAILLVMLLHLNAVTFAFPVFEFGWMGVDLFFVLSGFLITGLLFENRNENNYYKKFLFRRTLRIFPLYYLFLLVYFLSVYIWPWLVNHAEYILIRQHWYWAYATDFLYSFERSTEESISHFWSLAIEEQFYLVWPLIVMMYKPRHLGPVILLFMVFAVIIRNVHYVSGEIFPYYTLPWCRMDSLLAGALGAWMIREKPDLAGKFILPAGLISFAGIFFFKWVFPHPDTWVFFNEGLARFGFTCIAIFFLAFILLAVDKKYENKIPLRLLKLSWLRWLGVHAYGIYIFHNPALRMFYNRLFLNSEPFMPESWPYPVKAFLVSLVIYGAVLGLAALSYRYFERPILMFRERFFREKSA